jgi:hypothetical protein
MPAPTALVSAILCGTAWVLMSPAAGKRTVLAESPVPAFLYDGAT